jgi:hypothetical protein
VKRSRRDYQLEKPIIWVSRVVPGGGRIGQRGQTHPCQTKRRWKSASGSVGQTVGDKQENEKDYSS